MKNIPLEQMGRTGELISTHVLTHAELMSDYFHVYKGIRGRKKKISETDPLSYRRSRACVLTRSLDYCLVILR